MDTISINLNVPQGWHELDDVQLRYAGLHWSEKKRATLACGSP